MKVILTSLWLMMLVSFGLAIWSLYHLSQRSATSSIIVSLKDMTDVECIYFAPTNSLPDIHRPMNNDSCPAAIRIDTVKK